MKRYITYDLKDADSSDYKELLDLIKSYPNNTKITESTYLVDSSEDLDVFKQKLANVTKKKDSVFIIRNVYYRDTQEHNILHEKIK